MEEESPAATESVQEPATAEEKKETTDCNIEKTENDLAAAIDRLAVEDKSIGTVAVDTTLDLIGAIDDIVKDGAKNETAEAMEETESLGGLEEMGIHATGSDSGVEGCGRALSSGGGSRSCASSVVSCGSGCGSESSSLNSAPSRTKRRVALNEPSKNRPPPFSASTPRAPNLATRERARSREKPALPEKPRPLTPKPRVRPNTDLPNLIRESPALRAKPTKTSAARCRTPSSPGEEKRWPSIGPRLNGTTEVTNTRSVTDKYATLPRRRKEDGEESPRRTVNADVSTARRLSSSRPASTRTSTKTRVRIYAEKVIQTALLGNDIEALLEGRSIRTDVFQTEKAHKGVQACGRNLEIERLTVKLQRVEEELAAEKTRREGAETQLEEERVARRLAESELENNSRRLLELAGGGQDGADACLRALDEQLRAAAELAATQRLELDRLRDTCRSLQVERRECVEREGALRRRLAESERDAHEMQEFLTAEMAALADSLRDNEAELATANVELDRRRSECRQLVRWCEARRQEALAAAARAQGALDAARALDALARRLRALLPAHAHNATYSRSESAEVRTPEELSRPNLIAAIAHAVRTNGHSLSERDDERSLYSDELLDSETEPGLESCGSMDRLAWSADELSPVRDPDRDPDPDPDPDPHSASDRDSLRNLSVAILQRQRSEAAEGEGGAATALPDRVRAVDALLTALLRLLAAACGPAHRTRYVPPVVRQMDYGPGEAMNTSAENHGDLDEIDVSAAEAFAKKLAELATSKMADPQQTSTAAEEQRNRSVITDDIEDLESIEEEVRVAGGADTARRWYAGIDGALGALSGCGWARIRPPAAQLERLAFALATLPAPKLATVPSVPAPGAPAALDTTA